jgi:hypothetical protein
MVTDPATRKLGELLRPSPPADFFERLPEGRIIHVPGEAGFERTKLLGDDPAELLIANWAALADKIGFHAVTPTGPPPGTGPAAGEDDFRNRIKLFHDRGYSVRFPDLRPFSQPLDLMARALESRVHQPVTAAAFWSKGGLRAPVHFDDRDIIAVQLVGEKQWEVSGAPSPLRTNQMIMPDEAVTAVPEPVRIAMRAGDVLYVPRGCAHTVDGQVESLHISFMFHPVTVRDALVAAIDELTTVDRAFREAIGGDLRTQLANGGARALVPAILKAAGRLQESAASEDFLQAALRKRSGRALRGMEPLPALRHPAIDLDTRLKRSESALCVLVPGERVIELNYPGGKIYIHRGVEEALSFMVEQPEFRVRDVPGNLPPDVLLALAGKLLAFGQLEVAGKA